MTVLGRARHGIALATVEISLADVTAATPTSGRDYEFRYFMHAGWDESGV